MCPRNTNQEDIEEKAFIANLSIAGPEFTLDTALDLDSFDDALTSLDPVLSAALFSGLLLTPDYQANTLRLEALIHLVFSKSSGKAKIDKDIAKLLFEKMNKTYFSSNEDPIEDVMIATVYTTDETYCIHQGSWEGSAFYLQRFISLMQSFPSNDFYQQIKDSVSSLLKISEEIVNRSNLKKYQAGEQYPQDILSDESVANISRTIQRVSFSAVDLAGLGIKEESLAPFVFNSSDRGNLISIPFSSSPLSFAPLVYSQGIYYVLLPSSINIAIDNFLIEFSLETGMKNALNQSVQNDYLSHFYHLSILGEIRNLTFNPVKNPTNLIIGAETTYRIDEGRHIHFLLIFDDFDEYDEGHFNGVSPHIAATNKLIEERILETHKRISSTSDFREGLSLVVSCGWGRLTCFSFLDESIVNWCVEIISAPDFTTFSNLPFMDPLSFWRFIETKKTLSNSGIALNNINGLLNLYAWAEGNSFHLVPHDQMPEELSPLDLENTFISISQNSLLNARQEALESLDTHIVKKNNHNHVLVQKINSNSYFIEDRHKPIFASITGIEKGDLVALIKGNFNWWCSTSASENDDRDLVYRMWDGAKNWAYRLDKVLSPFLKEQGFKGNIYWDFKFETTDNPELTGTTPSYSELVSLCRSKSHRAERDIYVSTFFLNGFIKGIYQESNSAEKALVSSLLLGILNLFSEKVTTRSFDLLVNGVVTNNNSRHIHLFPARNFREFVRESMPEPLLINDFDETTSKIGLGWIARNPTDSAIITGIPDCTKYLRELVEAIFGKMQHLLGHLNREQTIHSLLVNHESVCANSDLWKKTSRAVIGLHEDKEESYKVIAEQAGKSNGTSIGTRIALEMAICECKAEGGHKPGNLDITKLIMHSTSMHNIGCWSDTIRYQMTEPKIRISPTGDILFDHTFVDAVITPYSMETQTRTTRKNVKDYSKLFQENSNTSLKLDETFLEAWHEEYLVTIEEFGNLLHILDNYGIDNQQVTFQVSEESFIAFAKEAKLTQSQAEYILKKFTLTSRQKWITPPEGYKDEDIVPWKFKRRLSSISRPIIKLTNEKTSELFVTPELLRTGITHLYSGAYEGQFGEGFYDTKAMRRWVGHKRNLNGHQFNKDVADEFKKHGWQAEPDVFLTKILNRKLDKDYGDIDVLAWQPKTGEVLAIECKDLLFARTPAEIARQAYEFKGKTLENGKPDRLLKHLRRTNLLFENLGSLKKYIKLSPNINLTPCLLFSNIVPMSFINTGEVGNIKKLSFESISHL